MNNSAIKLKDVAELTVGFVGNMTKEYTNEGICFFRSLNIRPFSIDSSDLLHISSDFNEQIKKSELHEGDLVIVRTGRPGACCVIPKEFEGSNCSDLVIIRPDQGKIDSYYLEAYINFMTQKQISNNQVGAIQKHFNIGSAKDMILFLPELKTQKEIGSIVRSLNSKISNNDKINAELEAMAKTIYDYWFLQFEFPNEEGKPYKSSGGKMVWNEELKREIPEGWSQAPLEAFIEKSKNGDWGNATKTSDEDIVVNCFRGADFPTITTAYTMTAPVRYIKHNNADRLLEDGDLFVEISGGSPTQSTGRIGYINKELLARSNNSMSCSNFCKAFMPTDKRCQFWLYQTWLTLYDQGVMFGYESKTTGLKNLMFGSFVSSVKVPCPTIQLLSKYQDFCSLIYGKVQKSLSESQELANLRNFLLPLLMNGQVGFKDE